MIFSPIIVILGATASLALMGAGYGRHAATMRLNRRLTQAARTPNNVLLHSSGWVRLAETALVTGDKDRQEIRLALRQAAFTDPRAFGWFAIGRIASALVCAGIAAIVLLHIPMSDAGRAFAIFGAFAVPFLVSKRVLRIFAVRRVREIQKELPFLIDMLVLMLESGISLDQALRQFALTKMTGMEQTRRATIVLVDDLQKGMAYDQALARWTDRLAADGVRDLAGLIAQSVMHGTELAPTLRDFSREMADRRLSNAREAVGRKATQMTMVMVVCLLPALMIVLAGPAVATVNHIFAKGRH